MLFYPGPYEALLIGSIIAFFAIGPFVMAGAVALVRRWRARRARRRGAQPAPPPTDTPQKGQGHSR